MSATRILWFAAMLTLASTSNARAATAPDYFTQWGSSGSGAGQFNSPIGVAIGTSGNVYVADTNNNRIQVFTSDGAFLTAWGSQGSADWQFNVPLDLDVDGSGNVYVLDTGNSRILEFTSSGTFLRKWGSPGNENGHLNNPRAIAVDRSGAVYVADSNNFRIQKFTSVGVFLGKWGSFGFGDGEFGWPIGIAIDAEGNVYVADNGNTVHRIQKFSNTGAFLTKWNSISPWNLVIDISGYVYVANRNTHMIQKYSSGGNDLGAWGGEGGTNGLFTFPMGVAVDATGNVYVADTNNNRIQTFRYVNILGVYSDSGRMQRLLCAPKNAATTFALLATTGGPTSSGITQAEFRIEVTNPSGYLFSYTAPNGAFAQNNPFSPAGTSVVFPSCQPPTLPRAAGDIVSLGTITVFNSAGGPSDLLIKRKNPQATCPRFFECDSPFFTRVCMSSTETDSIVFRASINGPSCQAAPPQPFVAETLFVDTREASNDGAAGPINTLQDLDSRQSFLVTVQGTCSLWPATSWGPPPIVICGTPERLPQRASPGVTNGWVGVDAEIDFSVPLPPNGDCATLPSQGYPRHPGWFQMDLGSGFSHIEPLGGAPTNPSPGHLYRYLLQGQNKPFSFAWFDSLTSDHYGVLTIIVEQRNTTDVPSAARILRRLTMLPNMPNPFNPSTEIRYVLPDKGPVEVRLYDIRGQLLRRLFAGSQAAGYQSVYWNGQLDDGRKARSGVYFARVTSDGLEGRSRLVLLK